MKELEDWGPGHPNRLGATLGKGYDRLARENDLLLITEVSRCKKCGGLFTPECQYCLSCGRKLGHETATEIAYAITLVSSLILYGIGVSAGESNSQTASEIFWACFYFGVVLWISSLILAFDSKDRLLFIVSIGLGFMMGATFLFFVLFAAVAGCPFC